MIASLPMYATPQTARADARFWALIRDSLRHHGLAAPETLTTDIADLPGHWCASDLVLSQTCSLPYRARLRDHVTLIGTPDYALPDCPPGYYNSVVIARSDDTRADIAAFLGAHFAYNDMLSQSGWAAVTLDWPAVAKGPLLQTGSHAASVRAVQERRADFAAIDAVSFRQLASAGAVAGLCVIKTTAPTPALPFITRAGQDPQPYRAAISHACAGLSSHDAQILGLCGLMTLPDDAYDLPLPPLGTPNPA